MFNKFKMEIDLVYLWVDGQDPVWLKKKCAYLPPEQRSDLDAVGDCRYEQHDELRYSLRSVERYAPWIRNIFIVTDGQVPVWLDRSNPRVKIIDHREILPADALPVFNSSAIEMCLWRIPGLSEHFLFANDDMFFAAPLEPAFFFDNHGYPYVRLKKQAIKHHLDRIYPHKLYHAQQLIAQRFGKKYTWAPHHNIDAYCLSDFKACYECFREEFETTSRSRFRLISDLQRSVVLYYALAVGHATEVHISRCNRIRNPWRRLLTIFGWGCATDSRCIPVCESDFAAIMKKYRPALICLNDDHRGSDENRRLMCRFLNELFPAKSAFEQEDTCSSSAR